MIGNTHNGPNNAPISQDPPFQKPDRFTLLRIRYYEFKIRLEDWCDRFMHRINKNVLGKIITFGKQKQQPVDTPNVTKTEGTAENHSSTSPRKNRGRSRYRNRRLSDADDEESELEPGEVRIRNSYDKFKSRDRGGRSSRKRYRCRDTNNPPPPKSRQRKRRSSLTRTISSTTADNQLVPKKSQGSGDINSFANSENKNSYESGKPVTLIISKKEKRLLKKEAKKLKTILKKRGLSKTKSSISEIKSEEMHNNPFEVEKHAEDDVGEDRNPLESAPPSNPNLFNNTSAMLAAKYGISQHSQPKTSIWEYISNLSNRKRRRSYSPRPLQVGFELTAPFGEIRRKGFKSQKDTAVALLQTVGKNADTIGNYVGEFSRSISEEIYQSFKSSNPPWLQQSEYNSPSSRYNKSNLNPTEQIISSSNEAHERLSRHYAENADVLSDLHQSPSGTVTYEPKTPFTAKYSNLLK